MLIAHLYFYNPSSENFQCSQLIQKFLITYFTHLPMTLRYLLITHPHKRRTTDPKYMAQMKIAILLLCCVVLHLPMAAQNKLRNNNGKWHKGNNIEFLCS